jgi:exodeoxyribonuclease VII large subunit
MRKNIYSVGQVNTYIQNMFAQDFMLHQISIKGEVSNCKYHSSGHIYFTLKDQTGTIAAVMFSRYRRGLAFQMKEGDKVVVTGSVEVYERDGKYQLYAREIELEGAGNLYLKFEALKRELEEMGMFDAAYKKPIPRYATRIGIVTAPTGAAIQDIRNIAARRNPYVQLILYPALVQGDGAAASIVRGIHALDVLGVDVIIVGRGGGSIEDLWAFNERMVAQAVFDCTVPIISAVGHETDTTIIDYVADLRAPTPSAAAELAVTAANDIDQEILSRQERLYRQMDRVLQRKRQQAEQREMRLKYLSPANRIREKRTYSIQLEERLENRMQTILRDRRHTLALYIERMKAVSPLEKLNSGFSYVEAADGKNIRSVTQVHEGDSLRIRVSDGVIDTKVEQVQQGDRFTV